MACEEAVSENCKYNADFDEVLAFARKIAPSIRPPQGLRFSPDQGPLEALPARFRLPFPCQDEMRQSAVFLEGNKMLTAATPPETPSRDIFISQLPVQEPVADKDEFADDF